MSHVPPTASNMAEWVRKAANAINSILSGKGAPNNDSDPENPIEGQYYWNTATKKLRLYDGTAWVSLN